MIQRTAIWILATLALCSPGTVVIHQIREPIGAGYEVRSVQIVTDGVRQTISRLSYRPPSDSSEISLYLLERPTTAAGRLYFGSLYNRPPPASLSFI